MAWYYPIDLFYRGRKFTVNLRYGYVEGGGGFKQVSGKPLRLTRKDLRKLCQIVDHQKARPWFSKAMDEFEASMSRR